MEKVLYRCYLKFLKNENKKMWKEMKRIPVKFWWSLLAILILSSFPLMNLKMKWFPEIISYVLQVISLFLCIPWYFGTESYKVDISDGSLTLYLQRCIKLREWLKEQGVDGKKKIEIICKRINKEVDRQKKKKEKITEKIVGVIQILIIPIILLIISNYGKEEENFEIGVARIVTTLLVFGIFFVWIFMMANTINMFKNSQIAQLEIFASDLQGVLDLELFEKTSERLIENKEIENKKKEHKKK